MSVKIEAVKGKSPYAKQGKTPFKYGEHYSRWEKATGQAGATYGSEEALAADRAFRRYFNVPTGWANGSHGGKALYV